MRKGIALFAVFVVLFVAGMLIPDTGTAQSKITLSYANFTQAGFPLAQMDRWVKEVEKRTNGKVKINTFPGSTLLGPKNMFDGVVSGTADIGNSASSYQPGRFPIAEAVDLPLGFTSSRAASLALFDMLEKYPKDFEKVKLLTAFTCPPADFMTSKPVRSLKDLKGMELRVAGTGAEVVRRVGGIPIAMPQSDTPEALQKGVVKGIVSSTEILQDFNFAAYCPYVTEAKLFVVTFYVIMNNDKWNSLPADVKKVMDDLRRDQAEWTGKYVDNHCEESIAWSKKKYQLQVFRLPASEMAEIPKMVRPMIDDYLKRVTAQGLPGQQILNDVYSLRDKYEKQFAGK